MLRIGVVENGSNQGSGNFCRVRTFELFPKVNNRGVDENESYRGCWQQGKIINLPSYYSMFSGESFKIAAQRHSGVKILSEANQQRFLSSVSKNVCSCFPVLALLTLDKEMNFTEKTDLRPYFKEIECSLVDDHE